MGRLDEPTASAFLVRARPLGIGQRNALLRDGNRDDDERDLVRLQRRRLAPRITSVVATRHRDPRLVSDADWTNDSDQSHWHRCSVTISGGYRSREPFELSPRGPATVYFESFSAAGGVALQVGDG